MQSRQKKATYMTGTIFLSTPQLRSSQLVHPRLIEISQISLPGCICNNVHQHQLSFCILDSKTRESGFPDWCCSPPGANFLFAEFHHACLLEGWSRSPWSPWRRRRTRRWSWKVSGRRWRIASSLRSLWPPTSSPPATLTTLNISPIATSADSMCPGSPARLALL